MPLPHVVKLVSVTNKKLRKIVQKATAKPLFGIGKNAKYDFSQLMTLPIASALENRSVEDQSQTTGRISADDFFYHFKNKLKLDALQSLFRRNALQVKRILKSRHLLHERLIIAIDKTEDLYWGNIENPFVTGGKREASTNYAFRYLTAAIVLQGQRFFLHVRPLTDKDDNDALLVEECLGEIRKLGFKVGTVLMDREFFNGTIILIFNIHKLEYIVPVVKNSKFERLIKEMRNEGKTLPRIIENYVVAEQLTNLVIYEDKNKEGEMEVFGFITNIEVEEISADVHAIIDLYRMRWGIENAHKFHDSFRIKTNSTDGIIRFFFFLLGVIFHNLWVLLNLLAASFGAFEITKDALKDILKMVYGFAAVRSYKHPQRQLWVKILVG